MAEDSDRPTVEEIAEMDIEEDVLDALTYGVWSGPTDTRTAGVMDMVETVSVDVTQGMRPEWSIGYGPDVTVDDIETSAIDDAVEKIAEKREQEARDRLKGQRPPPPQTGLGSLGLASRPPTRVMRAPETLREALKEHADATIKMKPETYECGSCGVRRPVNVVNDGDFEADERMNCYGPCDGSTVHHATGEEWAPTRYEFECPECGYETIMWECPEMEGPKVELPECPECPPPPEGPAGIPVVPTKDASVDDVPGAVDATKALDELTDIAGVGESKGMALISDGYYSKEDVRRATQQELADVDGWGNALAARVKADVGDASDTELILAEVRLEADAED